MPSHHYQVGQTRRARLALAYLFWFEPTLALEKPQKLSFAVLLRDAIDNLSPRELWGGAGGMPPTYLPYRDDKAMMVLSV